MTSLAICAVHYVTRCVTLHLLRLRRREVEIVRPNLPSNVCECRQLALIFSVRGSVAGTIAQDGLLSGPPGPESILTDNGIPLAQECGDRENNVYEFSSVI